MSKKKNFIAKMYSGIFGRQVTLEPRGRKILMTFPHKRKVPVATGKQIDYRRKFQRASQCAKNILKDPEVLKAYRALARKGQTAYNLALRDYLSNRLEGLTSLQDLPCFDSGAVHNHQKTDPRGKSGKRTILFSVPGDLRVPDGPAVYAGHRSIHWSFQFTRLFKRKRSRAG
jgi:hypothetical protein